MDVEIYTINTNVCTGAQWYVEYRQCLYKRLQLYSVPIQSRSLLTEHRFWKDLFQVAIERGLVVYEQDWLDVQYEMQSPVFHRCHG
jgi:hypothetical protein